MGKLDNCLVTRQCYSNNHCRLNYLSSSDLKDIIARYSASRQCYSTIHYHLIYLASTDLKAITVGLELEPAMMSNHHYKVRVTCSDRKTPALPLAHYQLVCSSDEGLKSGNDCLFWVVFYEGVQQNIRGQVGALINIGRNLNDYPLFRSVGVAQSWQVRGTIWYFKNLTAFALIHGRLTEVAERAYIQRSKVEKFARRNCI